MKLFLLLALLFAFDSASIFAISSDDEDLRSLLEDSSVTEKRRKFLEKELREKIGKSIYASGYDSKVDYTKFSGRVSDKDSTGTILKIKTENSNIKFLRAGDKILFKVSNITNRGWCDSYVRDVEKDYFSVYTKDVYICWGSENYFRRGTTLIFNSPTLAKRVKDASVYRMVLLKRRKDFFRQLNGVNHFLWSYKQKLVEEAIVYDKKILDLKKIKEKALGQLQKVKKDKIVLQRELSYRLDSLEKDLSFYQIERPELYVDRWHLDHDLGKPVQKRPQLPRESKASSF